MKKLDIIYEDKNILVINKPSGLLTISTKKEKEKTLFYETSMYVKKSNPKAKIFIINRLDKETSGLVMFAKNQTLKYKYQNNWNSVAVKRSYIALVHNKFDDKKGTIKSYLKQTNTSLVYSSNDKKNGKLAITDYEVIEQNNKYALLNVDIKTGRKNQIRVHLKDINHPIVGDKKYGIKDKSRRLMLHAYYLKIINPVTKKEMEFTCKIPKEFEIQR